MRTETIERTVYTFGELSDKAKSAAISEYATYSGWDDGTLDYCREVAISAGFCAPEIGYSGFCSQGDGACIVGTWYASDVRDDGEWGEEVRALLAPFLAAPKGLSASLRHVGHYSHEHSVSVTFSWDADNIGDRDAVEEATEKGMRDFMRWVYRTLEEEYEYLTSVDCFAESCEANGWEFTEDGALA